jgi:hypothetical protein
MLERIYEHCYVIVITTGYGRTVLFWRGQTIPGGHEQVQFGQDLPVTGLPATGGRIW